VVSVVILATPTKEDISIERSPNRISAELTSIDYRKYPEGLLDDCVQVRQILNLGKRDRIVLAGKSSIKL
jgi:hypothetical protein